MTSETPTVYAATPADVRGAVLEARRRGLRVAVRATGHGTIAEPSPDTLLIDTSGMRSVLVDPDRRTARVGPGTTWGDVIEAAAPFGLAPVSGTDATVGVTGFTFGGGHGFLSRRYGLAADNLLRADVVTADGETLTAREDRRSELFWALRGAGGGQFGVVTSLRFDTVPEPMTTRIEARWSGIALEDLVSAWQAWAPDAPDELTINLSLVSEPGVPVQATLFGASMLDQATTRESMQQFIDRAGATATIDMRAGLPYSQLKSTFGDPLDEPERLTRLRSEFFSTTMADGTIASLLTQFSRTTGRRELALTAMGGAYNRIVDNATAFAHRSTRFLLEHIADADDPWVDESWATAHADGSGRVYPNFPDSALDDWASAYHADNYPRLAAVRRTYDPHRFFDFPQAI